VTHYEALQGRLAFTASSMGKHKRAARLADLARRAADGQEFYCDWAWGEQPLAAIWQQWTMDDYDGAPLAPAEPRGFTAWAAAHVPDATPASKRCGNGIFLTSADQLRRRPRAFYEALLQQLAGAEAPEAGHYLERLAVAVFGANAPLPVAEHADAPGAADSFLTELAAGERNASRLVLHPAELAAARRAEPAAWLDTSVASRVQ
jgi:hypothetical protein